MRQRLHHYALVQSRSVARLTCTCMFIAYRLTNFYDTDENEGFAYPTNFLYEYVFFCDVRFGAE